LRVSPAFDTTGVALLPRGAQVRIVECRKQTCKVEFRQLRGYVLRELGHEVVAIDISEYRKMDGGLSCLSVRW
ncbi:MAG TPA: hypothetical protein VHH32_00290, partial [Gemmatimonadales bacterium]|nr:hypothetical protein [Gemmatimonadales bacterium]